MRIGSTYENSQVTNLWFPSMYRFIWCLPFYSFSVYSFSGATIAKIDSASAQNDLGNSESANIERTISINVPFNRSATPFSSGDLGVVSSCFIPSFLRYS